MVPWLVCGSVPVHSRCELDLVVLPLLVQPGLALDVVSAVMSSLLTEEPVVAEVLDDVGFEEVVDVQEEHCHP